MENISKTEKVEKAEELKENKKVYGNWWSTIVYPDSCDIYDVVQININKWMIPMWISPLHDSDIDEFGELKKPHFHVLFKTNNTVARDYVLKTFVMTMGGVGTEKVHNSKGMLRYLCHLDNPEKTQYSTNDVLCVCTTGYGEYDDLISINIDKTNIGAVVMDYICTIGCYSFAELMFFFRKQHLIDELNYCMGHAYAVCQILKSINSSDKEG